MIPTLFTPIFSPACINPMTKLFVPSAQPRLSVHKLFQLAHVNVRANRYWLVLAFHFKEVIAFLEHHCPCLRFGLHCASFQIRPA
jgi:hypothetical protein